MRLFRIAFTDLHYKITALSNYILKSEKPIWAVRNECAQLQLNANFFGNLGNKWEWRIYFKDNELNELNELNEFILRQLI